MKGRIVINRGKSLLFAVVAAGIYSTPGLAQDRCYSLWLERNQIYKDAGYCFKTARAIRTFGNAGCIYDDARDVILSANERRRIAAIVRAERSLGCSR